MIVCLSLFPANHLTLLSALAIAGGLYFFVVGFRLLAHKHRLQATPTSDIGSAALGPVEIHGMATGPNTMPAPITGKPCFLYHTTVWQLREGKRAGKKEEWEKIADETLHLPFFLHDSTGQLLVEPLGADLSLDHDFREEFAPKEVDVPPRVSVFLSRHGIVPSRRLRIDERLIESEDALFIAGTLTENPGIQVRPVSPGRDSPNNCGRNPAFSNSDQRSAPQIIQLSSGPAPSSTRDMSQQAKIAAALNRAGIIKPEAWSAAGIPYNPAAIEENPAPAPNHEASSQKQPTWETNFNLNPPMVLMKGGNNPAFVISHRSQKEFVDALAWKSFGMVCGGTAITLLGIYVLLTQMRLP